MTNKRIIEELKRTNPKEYIRLCEATGQKKKAQDYALRYYSKSRDALEICTAAGIALELGNNNLVKMLVERAINSVDEEMRREKENAQRNDGRSHVLLGNPRKAKNSL